MDFLFADRFRYAGWPVLYDPRGVTSHMAVTDQLRTATPHDPIIATPIGPW